MLSIVSLKGGSGSCSSYYSAMYYSAGNIVQPQFHGKASEAMGVEEFSEEALVAFLEGRLPDGTQVGKIHDGKILHRMGFDLTLAAPKSVSIMSVLDERLQTAMHDAVQDTMRFIEKSFAQARLTKNGETKYIHTKNLIWSTFLEHTSRNGDPHLHAHNLIFNLTQVGGGKWRSLASAMAQYGQGKMDVQGFVESLRSLKIEISRYFGAALAHKVVQLGYQIDVQHSKDFRESGLWELRGMPKNIMTHFSSRKEEMKKFGNEKGGSIAQERSRKSKESYSPESLAERVALFKEEIESSIEAIKQERTPTTEGIVLAKKAIGCALESLSERQSVFSISDIQGTASLFLVGQWSPACLDDAMKEMINEGELVAQGKKHGQYFFSTKVSIELDAQRLKNAKTKQIDGTTFKEKLGAIPSCIEAKKILAPFAESANQSVFVLDARYRKRRAGFLREIALASRRFGKVVFLASETQKKSLEKNLASTQMQWRGENTRETLRLAGRNLLSMAVENKWHVYTIGTALHNTSLIEEASTIIVDGAEKLSDSQYDRLKAVADARGIPLFLSGDMRNAGSRTSIMQKLVDNGAPTAHDGASTAPRTHLGKVLSALYRDQPQQAISLLKKNIHGSPDFEQKAIAYFVASILANKKAELVANSKNDLLRLTDMARNALRDAGKLKNGAPMARLVQKYIPKKERGLAVHYENSKVRIFSKNPNIGGGFYDVLGVDSKQNTILIGVGDEKLELRLSVLSDCGISLSVFEQKDLFVEEGDRIQFRANIKKKGICSGDIFQINSISDEQICLHSSDGEIIELEKDNPAHQIWNMAWVRLPMQQGQKDAEQTISIQRADTTCHQGNLLQILKSAEKGKLDIFTENACLHGQKIAGHFDPSANLEEKTKKILIKTEESLRQSIFPCKLDADQAEGVVQDTINAVFEKEVIANPLAMLRTALGKAMGSVPPDALMGKIESSYMSNFESTKMPGALNYRKLELKRIDSDTKNADGEPVERFALSLQETSGINLARKIKEDCQLLGIKNFVSWDANRKLCILELKAREDGKPLAIVDARGMMPDKSPRGFSLKAQKKIETAALACAKKASVEAQEKSTSKTIENASQEGYSEEQRVAIHALVHSKDKIAVLQGRAGTGKTRLLSEVARQLAEKGCPALAIAPTHAAVQELKKGDIQSMTVAAFLLADSPKNSTIIVDEASMLDTETAKAVLEKAPDSRLIFVGDTNQFSSIGWGNFFSMLQKEGQAITHHLVDMQRQKTEHLKQAAILLYQEKGIEALEVLEKNGAVLESKGNAQEQAEQIAAHLFERSKDERDKTLVTASLNEHRVMLNDAIRAQRIVCGEVEKTGIQATVLVAKHIGEAESDKHNARYYSDGDIVRFSRGGAGETSEYHKVVGKDVEKNTLHLAAENGKNLAIDLARISKEQTPEVYQEEKREFAVGDRIIYTRSEKNMGRTGASYATIQSILNDGKTIMVVACEGAENGWKPSGKFSLLDTRDCSNQNIEHAYAVTGHKSQGQTVDHILSWIPSDSRLSTLKSVLISGTRAKFGAEIATENPALLKANIINPGRNLAVGDLAEQKQANAKQLWGRNIAEEAEKPKQSKSISHEKPALIDIAALKSSLNAQAEKIASQLPLGTLKRKQGHELYFSESGKGNGSLAINIKDGTWFDHQLGKGGGMLDLIEHATGMKDFKQLCSYAAGMIGSSPETLEKTKQLPKKQQEKKQGFSLEEKKRIAFAQKIAGDTKPIEGTLAEKYLVEHRKINCEKWPESVRFHPMFYSGINKKIGPALVVLATNEKGEVQAIQATFLDRKTAEKATNLKTSKQTFGILKGASVSLGRTDELDQTVKQSAIAEGLETGLSAFMACPKTNIEVSLGKSNMRNVSTQKLAEHLLILNDHDEDGDDGRGRTEMKMLAEKYSTLGKKVSFVRPRTPGHDFNDVLKEHGVEEIQRTIDEDSHDAGEHQQEEQLEMRRQNARRMRVVQQMQMHV